MSKDKMKYIAEVPTGFMVRKTVNREPHQRFYGVSRFGGREGALKAAMDYRDELVDKLKNVRTRHKQHINNITGIIGVSWWCGKSGESGQGVQHMFRARYVDENGEPQSSAFTVKTYGLWRAYLAAAEWRYYGTTVQDAIIDARTSGKDNLKAKVPKLDVEDVLSKFLTFFEHVKSALEDSKDPETTQEITDSLLMLMVEHETTPSAILKALPEEFVAKHDVVDGETKDNLKVLIGRDPSGLSKVSDKRRAPVQYKQLHRSSKLSASGV